MVSSERRIVSSERCDETIRAKSSTISALEEFDGAATGRLLEADLSHRTIAINHLETGCPPRRPDSTPVSLCSTFLGRQAVESGENAEPKPSRRRLNPRACNFSEQLRVIAYLQKKDCSRGQWQH
jgi:hypothetical protein